MISNEETFDRVWKGFEAQNFKRSLAVNGPCAYRSGDGCKCAIGILMPDSEYRLEFEGKNVYALEHTGVPFLKQYEIKFLKELQEVHDNYDMVFLEDGTIDIQTANHSLKQDLLEFARYHGIDTSKYEKVG